MNDKNVTVYTSTGCAHCQAAKKFLEENGVAFTEKNIAEDQDAAKELSKRGISSVPVVLIGEEIITGFDREKIKSALGLLP